jgi:hypothetical protein
MRLTAPGGPFLPARFVLLLHMPCSRFLQTKFERPAKSYDATDNIKLPMKRGLEKRR